ncbi:alkaline phosphatase family protein [Microbacterium sp. CFH 90308]|uniref:Alkaline phosphatase family protein n=1 Tax=Microbacterium salsuginis TaxID=2722803 RepID=A0ABX1KEJ9_9MICO|nr:nucleotide pyrophosphatase/phosphodiesterase family protein [Microbacterium sp. CFH 90308]NLP85471.1 alkaline phosphatase family protein [Microbacterium sp. CFH 90308]
MSLSLPADPPHARSLTRVVPEISAALDGRSGWFAPARSAVVWVLDGLGAHNLASRAGHARFLSGARAKKDAARTVFPSTTAAALTSLLTGTTPGQHGLVGYRARVPGTDDVVNQLRGWDTDGLPLSFQRATPLADSLGRPFFTVSRSEYAGTGFTAVTLGGAEFHGVDDLSERVRVAADLAARHPGSIVYLYAPDLDSVGHKRGWESDEWISTLESVDAAARLLDASLTQDTGVIVTSDHGMVDVPRHRHVLLGDGDERLDGVRLIGGEPRMLHLYAEPGEETGVLARWRDAEGARSWVFARDEVVTSGLMGVVAPEVIERIGDVIVAPRAGIAYYDDRLADKAPQRMVGQHGSLTDDERIVPLIRLGAFA